MSGNGKVKPGEFGWDESRSKAERAGSFAPRSAEAAEAPLPGDRNMMGSCDMFNPQCSLFSRTRMERSSLSYSRITIHTPTASKNRSASILSLKSADVSFFCDWLPVIFGVDGDDVPEEEEEEIFGEGYAEEEEQQQQEQPEEKEKSKPRYGRRARPKPIFQRKDGEEFECICDIDEFFDRHYTPHFGGGIKSEKEDWRIPHFTSYWEDYKEKLAAQEDESLLKLIEGGGGGDEKVVPVKEKEVPRRERKALLKVGEGRREILNRLRPLTCRELRRNRLPLPEAIILELEEDGFADTAAFVKSILIEEYLLDQQRESCPTVRNSKTELERLVKLLVAAERKGRKNDVNSQSVLLLKTGHYYNSSESTWWWLANRIYEKAVEASSKYVMDGGKSEAISRYIYGMFLLDYAGKVQAAQEHLTRARELSLGRDWNAGRVLKQAQEPIYKECCNYLCRALVETSKQLRKEGKPEIALQFIHQSYKLCQESSTSRLDIELETLYELGLTYQDTGELDLAKTALKDYIAKAKLGGNPRSICNGHLELAICYRMQGEINHCYYHLQCYLECAIVKGDENLKAFGNRYLGEFFLNQGYSKEASAFFHKAFSSFLEQYQNSTMKPFSDWLPEEFTLSQDVELARVLAGLAKGEILTKPICRLILRARDVRNEKDKLKLLKWKNAQEITFDLEEEEDTKAEVNVGDDKSLKSAGPDEGSASEDSTVTEDFGVMEGPDDD